MGSPQLKPHGPGNVDEWFSKGKSEMSPKKEGKDAGRKKEKKRKHDCHTTAFGNKSMYLGDSVSLISY